MDMLNPQSGRTSPSGGAGDSKSPTNIEGRPSSRLVRLFHNGPENLKKKSLGQKSPEMI